MKEQVPGNEDDATIITANNKQTPNDETVIRSSATDDVTVLNTNTSTNTFYVPGFSEGPAETITVGSVLQNRFVLKEVLGSGGMGTVYRATDLRREEAQDQQPDVAIKVLNDEFKDDPELFIALQRETKKSQILAHPNIVTVYDFDRDGKNVFMVMELLDGKPLSQYLRDEGAGGVPFKQAWHIIKGLALALAYAHRKNIIHSDFKPGNVFITADGGVKVLDFGIACAAVMTDSHNDKTVFNARDLGALTPAYASLEMLQGAAPDPADDVYALACVCFEILGGKHPFGKLSAQKALEINLPVPDIHSLDRRQRQALSHALAFKREQRTATVSQFLDEIEPKSIVPKLFAFFAVILLLGVGSSYFYFFKEYKLIDEEMIQLTAEQELAVKDFLELAQIHFDVGYITAPTGSNALWAYRQVLKIAPYNQEAEDGLKKVANAVFQQAFTLYENGQYKQALSKIEQGLEAVPKHPDLLDLKDKILQSGQMLR